MRAVRRGCSVYLWRSFAFLYGGAERLSDYLLTVPFDDFGGLLLAGLHRNGEPLQPAVPRLPGPERIGDGREGEPPIVGGGHVDHHRLNTGEAHLARSNGEPNGLLGSRVKISSTSTSSRLPLVPRAPVRILPGVVEPDGGEAPPLHLERGVEIEGAEGLGVGLPAHNDPLE